MTRGELFTDTEPDDSQVYKSTLQGDLTIHIFNPDQDAFSCRRPGIVFFFGGGWVGGTPSQFYTHCRYLSLRGMVAMTAEYRVRDTHGTSPRECVEDGTSCIRWIRQNASDLNIDPEKLCAGGGSAGGHVACATSFCDGFDAESDDTLISAKSAALILYNPVVDNGPDGFGNDQVADYWEQISPAHNVHEGVPPVLNMLGTKDNLIPVSSAEQFKQNIEAAGGRCDLKLYDEQPHGFFNYKDGDNPYFYQALLHTDEFLQSLGLLEESELTACLRESST